MTEKTTSEDHEQIGLLLPWFVNNTLDSTERDVVQRHLANCDECKEHLSLLSSVQSAVSKNSPTPIVPTANISELLESIEKEVSPLAPGPVSRRLIGLVASVFTVLIVTTLVLISHHRPEELSNRFDTATSVNQLAAMDYVLNIKFATDTTPTVRDRILQDIHATDIAVTEGDGTYRVTVSLQVSTLEDLERYTHDVESLQPVQSVEVVALQLPLSAPE